MQYIVCTPVLICWSLEHTGECPKKASQITSPWLHYHFVVYSYKTLFNGCCFINGIYLCVKILGKKDPLSSIFSSSFINVCQICMTCLFFVVLYMPLATEEAAAGVLLQYCIFYHWFAGVPCSFLFFFWVNCNLVL